LIQRLISHLFGRDYHQHHWRALYEGSHARQGPTAYTCSHPGCSVLHRIVAVPARTVEPLP
jgi:hypothetical protein